MLVSRIMSSFWIIYTTIVMTYLFYFSNAFHYFFPDIPLINVRKHLSNESKKVPRRLLRWRSHQSEDYYLYNAFCIEMKNLHPFFQQKVNIYFVFWNLCETNTNRLKPMISLYSKIALCYYQRLDKPSNCARCFCLFFFPSKDLINE